MKNILKGCREWEEGYERGFDEAVVYCYEEPDIKSVEDAREFLRFLNEIADGDAVDESRVLEFLDGYRQSWLAGRQCRGW